MNGFLSAHQAADGAAAPETMGYYTRADVPFYHALADAFTICDGYHCSVLGPTDPNRLMSLSGTIDPAGHHGGPLLLHQARRPGRRLQLANDARAALGQGDQLEASTPPAGAASWTTC